MCAPPKRLSVREGWWREAESPGELEVRTDAQIFSRACTDGLVFATLKRFCQPPSPSTWSALHPNVPQAEQWRAEEAGQMQALAIAGLAER